MSKAKPTGTLFPEWQAEQAAKVPAGLPKRIQDMHRMHGTSDGHRCGGCIHMVTIKRGATWFKCDQTRITGGAGTDWRKRWPACGLWATGDQIVVRRMD